MWNGFRDIERVWDLIRICKVCGIPFVCRYVHNNIFFSFAVDGDFSLMQQMRDQNLPPGESGVAKPTTSNGDVEADPVEKSEGDADASAAAAAVESEQATYASANNDLKGTKAYNNVDVSGLYTLAMAIVDYRGHRVVAQVCIPRRCAFG